MSDPEALASVEKSLHGVIKIDAAQIHSHLDSMVRSTVEQTLNKLLRRRIGYATRGVMSAAKRGWIPAQATIVGHSMPRWVRCI